jgi:hypothetical protein
MGAIATSGLVVTLTHHAKIRIIEVLGKPSGFARYVDT